LKTHILVVEDETQIARVLKMELESEGETNVIESTIELLMAKATRFLSTETYWFLID
jgi:DNA-binding response OmpR family regulator